MGANFTVSIEEAQAFQTVWNYKGVAVPFPPQAAHFAKDFANVVLRNFVDACQKQAQEAAKLQPKHQLIVEGIN